MENSGNKTPNARSVFEAQAKFDEIDEQTKRAEASAAGDPNKSYYEPRPTEEIMDEIKAKRNAARIEEGKDPVWKNSEGKILTWKDGELSFIEDKMEQGASEAEAERKLAAVEKEVGKSANTATEVVDNPIGEEPSVAPAAAEAAEAAPAVDLQPISQEELAAKHAAKMREPDLSGFDVMAGVEDEQRDAAIAEARRNGRAFNMPDDTIAGRFSRKRYERGQSEQLVSPIEPETTEMPRVNPVQVGNVNTQNMRAAMHEGMSERGKHAAPNKFEGMSFVERVKERMSQFHEAVYMKRHADQIWEAVDQRHPDVQEGSAAERIAFRQEAHRMFEGRKRFFEKHGAKLKKAVATGMFVLMLSQAPGVGGAIGNIAFGLEDTGGGAPIVNTIDARTIAEDDDTLRGEAEDKMDLSGFAASSSEAAGSSASAEYGAEADWHRMSGLNGLFANADGTGYNENKTNIYNFADSSVLDWNLSDDQIRANTILEADRMAIDFASDYSLWNEDAQMDGYKGMSAQEVLQLKETNPQAYQQLKSYYNGMVSRAPISRDTVTATVNNFYGQFIGAEGEAINDSNVVLVQCMTEENETQVITYYYIDDNGNQQILMQKKVECTQGIKAVDEPTGAFVGVPDITDRPDSPSGTPDSEPNSTPDSTPNSTPDSEPRSTGNEDNGSTGNEDNGSTGNEDQTTGNEDESTGNEDESTGNEDQTTGNEDESTGNEDESTGNEDPSTGDENPSTGNEDQDSTGNEDESTGNEDQTTGNEDESTGNEDQTTGNEDESTGNEDQTTGNEDESTGNEDESTGNEDQTTGDEDNDLKPKTDKNVELTDDDGEPTVVPIDRPTEFIPDPDIPGDENATPAENKEGVNDESERTPESPVEEAVQPSDVPEAGDEGVSDTDSNYTPDTTETTADDGTTRTREDTPGNDVADAAAEAEQGEASGAEAAPEPTAAEQANAEAAAAQVEQREANEAAEQATAEAAQQQEDFNNSAEGQAQVPTETAAPVAEAETEVPVTAETAADSGGGAESAAEAEAADWFNNLGGGNGGGGNGAGGNRGGRN